MSNANERQVGGQHYQSKFQHWDWITIIELPYLAAQVSKYLTRWRKKNGLQDLEKAAHFLAKYTEIEEIRQKTTRKLTDNFLASCEDLGVDDRKAIMFLTQHMLGDLELLRMAERCVQRLITVEQDRLVTGGAADGKAPVSTAQVPGWVNKG